MEIECHWFNKEHLVSNKSVSSTASLTESPSSSTTSPSYSSFVSTNSSSSSSSSSPSTLAAAQHHRSVMDYSKSGVAEKPSSSSTNQSPGRAQHDLAISAESKGSPINNQQPQQSSSPSSKLIHQEDEANIKQYSNGGSGNFQQANYTQYTLQQQQQLFQAQQQQYHLQASGATNLIAYNQNTNEESDEDENQSPELKNQYQMMNKDFTSLTNYKSASAAGSVNPASSHFPQQQQQQQPNQSLPHLHHHQHYVANQSGFAELPYAQHAQSDDVDFINSNFASGQHARYYLKNSNGELMQQSQAVNSSNPNQSSGSPGAPSGSHASSPQPSNAANSYLTVTYPMRAPIQNTYLLTHSNPAPNQQVLNPINSYNMLQMQNPHHPHHHHQLAQTTQEHLWQTSGQPQQTHPSEFYASRLYPTSIGMSLNGSNGAQQFIGENIYPSGLHHQHHRPSSSEPQFPSQMVMIGGEGLKEATVEASVINNLAGVNINNSLVQATTSSGHGKSKHGKQSKHHHHHHHQASSHNHNSVHVQNTDGENTNDRNVWSNPSEVPDNMQLGNNGTYS